ncbi:MAG: hypothetical protein ACT4OI_02115, partial [Methanobacteriota archaeon]
TGHGRIMVLGACYPLVHLASPWALTTEDRILLYLSDFRNMDERYALPQALTQKAIAYAAGIHRKHVSRYLDDMAKDGHLTERKGHIEGEKQRMLAYFLAPRGWERAQAIKARLEGVRVPVRVKGEVRHMTLQEIDAATSVHLTFADIVREAMGVETLDLESLESIDERRKRAMDERVAQLEKYTRAIMIAWKDGRVSATERLLVDQVREHLGITREEHERIEREVMEEVLSNRGSVYRAVAEEAIEDGAINDEERQLLEVLRKRLGMAPGEVTAIEAGLRPG